MKKQLEQYFGCEVKVAECKNTLELPIFMTMRDIKLVDIYGISFALKKSLKNRSLRLLSCNMKKHLNCIVQVKLL